MKRMTHPQHGWQMVQPADVPMFERAGWTECSPPETTAIDDPVDPDQPKPEPVKTRKRRVKNDDSV